MYVFCFTQTFGLFTVLPLALALALELFMLASSLSLSLKIVWSLNSLNGSRATNMEREKSIPDWNGWNHDARKMPGASPNRQRYYYLRAFIKR